MQNRYVGDVGDFGKHGLLRFLSGETDPKGVEPRLKLGLIWYTHHDERHNHDREKTNYDGKHTGYLVRTPKDDRKEYRECDPDLWERLRDLLLRDARCVHCAREMGILPDDTAFYDTQLYHVPGGSARAIREAKATMREHWFQGALNVTKGAELVCVDPDNGIAPDKDMFLKDGPKYVYMGDLQALWLRKQSLVIYHQLDHTDKAPEQARLKADTLQAGLAGAEPIPLLFHRGSARLFFVVPQPDKKELIKARVSRMLDSPWGKNEHFEWVGG